MSETPKFALLTDLGTIVVPADYDHTKALAKFAKANKKKCCYFNPTLTDANFSNPTRVLKAGDRLRVRAFEQIVSGMTSSADRMDFLRTQQAVFTGAQGMALVFEQLRTKLPKGKWYASLDEKRRLPVVDGYRGVPDVRAFNDGNFYVDLGEFGLPWMRSNTLLCFSDE